MNSLIIVGTGITGLTIAELLKNQIPNLALMEKSKSVGGRIATRRDELATYDHGAQFYKHSSAKPFLWHQKWLERQITQPWFTTDTFQSFSGTNGMTTLVKDLAVNKTIHFDEKVIRIQFHSNHLELETEAGHFFRTKSVILTSPLPQSLEILNNSQVSFPKALSEISFAKALVGLFEINDLSEKLFTEPFKKPLSSGIFSVANNKIKKISQNLCLTVVMTEEFSDSFFMDNDSVTLEKIKLELFKVYGSPFTIIKNQLKKWRFSHPKNCFPEPFFKLNSEPHLILAGDAFGGPSLHGAVKSALAVSKINFL